MSSRKPDGARPGHPIFAALYRRMIAPVEAGPVGEARRSLVHQARGVVVDLGAGIGLNLPLLGADVTEVHLVEPDPHMIRRMDPDLPGHVRVHQAVAEHLPLPDGSVDTVLTTLTLCTVGDLPAAVAEIRRVLRPGGQVLVLEHVRSADARTARWQDRLQGPWQWFGAGCNPNRDTAAAFAAAGFDTAPLTRLDAPGTPLTREWVTGRLAGPS
jgi:ubiquinone/menaquinone biosynthesis C-methylase UbiE